MTARTTPRRRSAAALVAVLGALCGLLLSAATTVVAASATGPKPSPVTATAPAHPDRVHAEGAHADGAHPEQGHAARAVQQAGDHDPEHDPGHGTGTPGCHRSHGDAGGLPATRGGGPHQDPAPPLAPCPAPASQAALGAAHATPPVRGPTRIPPPGPVSLSVLRV